MLNVRSVFLQVFLDVDVVYNKTLYIYIHIFYFVNILPDHSGF
jgi:hypothetical protein